MAQEQEPVRFLRLRRRHKPRVLARMKAVEWRRFVAIAHHKTDDSSAVHILTPFRTVRHRDASQRGPNLGRLNLDKQGGLQLADKSLSSLVVDSARLRSLNRAPKASFTRFPSSGHSRWLFLSPRRPRECPTKNPSLSPELFPSAGSSSASSASLTAPRVRCPETPAGRSDRRTRCRVFLPALERRSSAFVGRWVSRKRAF